MAASVLRDSLKLIGARQSIDLLDAVVGLPLMTRTIDGASTLTLQVADHDRKLLTYDRLDERQWVNVGDVNFELVQLTKSGDVMTLTFEDSIVAALRRQKSRLSIPAGTITRAQFFERLAREPRSNIPLAVDPANRGKVKRVLQRSVGEKSDSWVVSREAAEEVQWRNFSTGRQWVVGGDDWLNTRFKPTVLREHTGGVVSAIDFDLDAGKRASEGSLTIDASLFGIAPGVPVKLERMGPADGLWLVAEIVRPLTSTRAALRLVRGRHALKEPKREKPVGDGGDPDGVPDQGSGSSAGSASSNSARERMVQFALAQAGDSYVWGGNGPSGWDCSGLVQAATAAAGKTLGKPSASQWSTCEAAGKTISVSSALGIRGALLFRIGGEYNHVAISLGNGSTIEARGTAYGTGVFGGASGGGWTGAALWI